MRHRLALTVSACFMGLSLPSFGADLVEIYRSALPSDPVFAAARSAWQAGQEKLPQGLAGLLPQASISATDQFNDRDLIYRSGGTASQSKYNSNSATVSVSQPLYRKQNLTAYEQGKTQVAIANGQLDLASQDLILRVSQAYFDVLLARDNVAFAQAQKTAISEQLAQAKRNFEVGNATITDTHEAQARFDLVTAQELAAINDIEIKNRTLAQMIGKQPQVLSGLDSQFAPRLPELTSMDAWVERARSTNINVRVAEDALALAVQEVRRNRDAHYPTVDAFASVNKAGAGSGISGGIGTDTRSKVIGLQLAIPLYQGGLVDSRVREALANEEQARQNLENARRNAELAARSNYLGVSNGIAQVRALEAALLSNQSALDSTRLGQQVGVRTQVDVLNAQQLLFSARRDLAQARYNYVLSLLKLNAAAGKLSEADLQQVNAWLARDGQK